MAYTWPSHSTDAGFLGKIQVGESNYWLKDIDAREAIDKLSGYTEFLGVTTTDVTSVSGAASATVTIGGKSVTAKKGDIVIYGQGEFIWNGEAWAEFGDLSGIYDQLGDLAFNGAASTSYTPAGEISVSGEFSFKAATASSTVSTSGEVVVVSSSADGNYQPKGSIDPDVKTTPMKVLTDVSTAGTPPTFEADLLTATVGSGAASETLIFALVSNGFNPGAMPTFSSASAVASVTASKPTFTGYSANITFSGKDITFTSTITPELSTVPTYTFSGTSTSIVVTGSVSKPTT